MSEIKVNKISPRTNCGTTTLGDSGDTFTIPAGVTITNNGTQTGFGRTGAVDWQTTKKTTDFTAVNGEGYFVDTGSGVVTVTLPASPSAGNIVYIKDYDGNFANNKCTIARNSSNIRGATNNIDLDANNAGVVCIYVDATEGWQLFFDGSDADAQATFITASGGTEVTCGDFKTHIFTGPGTFTVSCIASSPTNNTVDYLVVAGGGGGGGNNPSGPTFGTGGGGAGGMRLSNSLSLPAPTMSPLSNSSGIAVAAQSYAITVGAGGGGGVYPGVHSGSNGASSTFGPITSAGGGFGSWGPSPGSNGGNPGGSGGGSGRDLNVAGGTGNTPSVSPPQGQNGAASFAGPYGSAGGGGGAGQAGQQGTTSNSPTTEVGGDGGAGSYIADGFVGPSAPSYGTPGPVGSTRYFAGGGGGGYWNNPAGRCTAAGDGGAGGGGQANASNPDSTAGTAGTTNTGGGGGGAVQGGAGGSGIVMIRYRRQ